MEVIAKITSVKTATFKIELDEEQCLTEETMKAAIMQLVEEADYEVTELDDTCGNCDPVQFNQEIFINKIEAKDLLNKNETNLIYLGTSSYSAGFQYPGKF